MELYYTIFVANIFTYIVIFLILKKVGGFTKNIGAYIVFSILFIYYVINPFYGVITDQTKLFGYDSATNIEYLSFLYLISSLLILLGILWGHHYKRPRIILYEKIEFDIKFARFWIIFGLVSIVLWAILSGYGLKTLFLVNVFMDVETDFNQTTRLYHLKQLFLVSVPGLLFAKKSKMSRSEFLIWFLLIFIVMLGFGFRYILIVIAMSFVIIEFISMPPFKRKIINLKNLTIILTLLISLLLIVQVRNDLKSATRGGSNINLNQKEFTVFSYDAIYKNTHNFISDSALINVIDQGIVDIDYGESMFWQIIIRALPSSIIGSKPFPKSIEASHNSWPTSQGKNAGAAFSILGEFYFTGGIFGVMILSILFGFVVHLLTTDFSSKKKATLAVVTIATLFHYVTRGFLPAFMMAYLFFIIPVFFIKKGQKND